MKNTIFVLLGFSIVFTITISLIFEQALAETIEAPLKQYHSKIDPHNIKCKPNLTLIFKDKIWNPTCVKPSSVEKLIERGWAAKHDPHHMYTMMPMDMGSNTSSSYESALGKPTTVSKASNFEECVAEGNPIMKSHPRQCRTTDGKHFVEMIDDMYCQGNARCISGGIVTSVIDGDTIIVNGQSVRFALASAPEISESDGIKAKNFVSTLCPIGSSVTVDEDDGQTDGSYERILAVVHCNGMNLNSELLDSGLGYIDSRFCDTSEFGKSDWAQKYGCSSASKTPIESLETINNCDPSYPDFCIPSPPPDLDCKDISQKRFTVLQPDPHRFDGDKDGIGCES